MERAEVEILIGMAIGVLAVQGGFVEHADVLQILGVDVRFVREVADLDGIAGLVIPGGESTVIAKLSGRFGLIEPMKQLIERGMPVYGTCAGAIFLARDIGHSDQMRLGTLDIEVDRNAFGRQADSFEESIVMPALGVEPFQAIFIRAPRIGGLGAEVDVLGRLRDGSVVAVQQNRQLATAFHPELTGDTRVHSYFIEMCRQASATRPEELSHYA